MTSDAAAVIEALGLSRPHVMGFSGGGHLAQSLAIAHPAAVGSLVLCGTFSEFDELMRRKARLWVQGAMAAESPEDFLRGFLSAIYTREAHADGRVDQWIAEMLAFEPQMSDEAFVTTLDGYAASSTADGLPGIGIPTLVIAGELDVVCPPPYSREIASRIPGAELVVMPGQAHQPFQEVPEEYNALVTGFWERIGA
jgi:pimeloyl-ACP methyl ester carboxylesterase